MKSKNIGYLMREGIRGIAKHGFMSFAAVSVMVACLVIIGSFVMVCYNIQLFITEKERENRLTVYVDESYSLAEARSVGTELSRIENIASKIFITNEEALSNFSEKFDSPAALEGVTADTFRHRYEIFLEDNARAHETISRIEMIDGVANVSFPEEVFEGFTVLQRIINIASIAIVTMLLVVSLLILSNTIKLAMYDRREEIGIMKMVGATNGFIRFPFIVQGVILGLLGGGIAFGLEWGLYEFLASKISEANSLNLFTLVPIETVLVPMAVVFGAVGLLVGVMGSVMSIRKFMDV